MADLLMDETPRQWKCPHGHVLGLVKRVRMGPGHISRLLLFRSAVDPAAEDPARVEVFAVIEGTALDIQCDICGEVRPWYIGADALEILKSKLKLEAYDER